MTKDEFITVFFGKLRDDEEFAERFHLENATFAKKWRLRRHGLICLRSVTETGV